MTVIEHISRTNEEKKKEMILFSLLSELACTAHANVYSRARS